MSAEIEPTHERAMMIMILNTLKLTTFNVFPSISGGKVALNHGSGLRRFNATFPPDIKGKTLLVRSNSLNRYLYDLRTVLD